VKRIHEEFGPQIQQARNSSPSSLVSMSKSYENGGHDRETKTIASFYAQKNPAFSEEKEWRILLVDYPSSISQLRYREANGLITPYLEIEIEVDAISAVTLGPLHPTPERDIERMLRRFDSSARVRRSSASYVVR
jgi:hypothetical protein